jgi:hypothetical protein
VYRFNPAANTWTAALSLSFRRMSMGFAATPDGMLYVFGGWDGFGTEGGGVGMVGLHGAGCAGRSHAACTRCAASALALSTHTSIYMYHVYQSKNFDRNEKGHLCKCQIHAISQNTLCPQPFQYSP